MSKLNKSNDMNKMNKSMSAFCSKKGIYVVFTAFFVVIAVVAALLWFIQLYSVLFEIDKEGSDSTQATTSAMLFKERLLLCHDKISLSEAKMTNCVDSGVKGYTIKRLPQEGCEESLWSYGTITQDDSRHSYLLPIQGLDGKKCLARVLIAT